MKIRRGHISWETMGASAGVWAVLWLTAGYAIVATTAADPGGADATYVRALMAERMKWEWVTLVRLVGGALVLWFAGTLAGRLRMAEGEPGRLAGAAFGPAVVWAGIWLLSALFNSSAIVLATGSGDPAGARLAAVLARDTPLVLTASVMFTVLLATALVALKSGGFPASYTHGTTFLAIAFLVLGVADWYGSWNLSMVIVGLAFAWMAVTSVLLVRGFAAVDSPQAAS
jgi:hypothetical protein